MPVTEYLLDNRATVAGARFAALSALFDDNTQRHVDALGIGTGAHCWEVGAGGPTMPQLLGQRVGPGGHVLATDLDVSWIDQVPPVVDVRRHDIAADELPTSRFDLVHARLVLVHVPQRSRALRRMAAALRPGGWLLIEDFDVELQPFACPEPRNDDEVRANRIRRGFIDLLGRRGTDVRYGRSLPTQLRESGLVDVAADAYFPLAQPAAARLEAANVIQVRDELIASGHATAEELDAHLAAIASGHLDLATPPLVSAWGRRTATA
jgi:SAM-dependent methyltransferase